MLKEKLLLGFLLCLCRIHIDAARILAIFPTPAISHQSVFRPLTHELVKRGHELVIITPNPAFPKGQAPPNLTEIDVHDISYNHWHELLLTHKGKSSDLISQIHNAMVKLGTVLELQLQTPEAQEILKKPKNYFDLIILEAYNRVAVGIYQIFDAPIIQMSTFGAFSYQYGLLGAPNHPLLYPTLIRQKLYKLSRWEKINQMWNHLLVEYVLWITQDNDREVQRRIFGSESTSDGYKRIKMLFVNEHPIWADNRPLPPNIYNIGGIHHIPKKELPKDLKSYLDASVNGVIYFSLGTSVLTSELPQDIVEIITRVFSKLPYDILMKWDSDELPGQPTNVQIRKWFPQSDLLKHPNIKLFITQAGLQSTDEAIDAAVPLLGIPMLGDQWYNSEKYVHHKIGLKLDLLTLNEISFMNSINTILKNKSFKHNIMRLRTLMREYPIKPLDLAVWWTEHIIKYGGDHLIPPSAFLSWSEYYEIELIIICLSIVVIIFCLIVYIAKIFHKIIKKKFSSSRKIKIN